MGTQKKQILITLPWNSRELLCLHKTQLCVLQKEIVMLGSQQNKENIVACSSE